MITAAWGFGAYALAPRIPDNKQGVTDMILLLLISLALFLGTLLFKLGTTCRNAACDGIVDAVDGGTPPGRIEHRTGSQPTNVRDASSGTLLGTNLFSNPAFGSASSGTATANSISNDSSADASGTAGYFRVYTGAGGDTAALFQGNSGTTSTDMVFDNNVIVAGGVIAISSFTITVPIS